jgi:hypothetical protein
MKALNTRKDTTRNRSELFLDSMIAGTVDSKIKRVTAKSRDFRNVIQL